MSSLDFKLMSLMFKVRDLLRPRSQVLREAEIEAGFAVLDFGCGPGSYIEPLEELVGNSGKIYALDMNPLAIQKIKKIANLKGYKNIEIINSDSRTGLQDNSVDTVLLYDVFHTLIHPNEILGEIHRVLKDNGTLSFSDHHMKEGDVLSKLTDSGMFRFVRKGENTFNFVKVA